MIYLLDTDTCIYILNHEPERVRYKFEQIELSRVAISSITLLELDAGGRKGSRVEENLAKVERFASSLTVLPFTAATARVAGKLKQDLRSAGTPIGDMDLLIAAHGLSLGAIVVTNNLREFARVPDLRVENWLE